MSVGCSADRCAPNLNLDLRWMSVKFGSYVEDRRTDSLVYFAWRSVQWMSKDWRKNMKCCEMLPFWEQKALNHSKGWVATCNVSRFSATFKHFRHFTQDLCSLVGPIFRQTIPKNLYVYPLHKSQILRSSIEDQSLDLACTCLQNNLQTFVWGRAESLRITKHNIDPDTRVC